MRLIHDNLHPISITVIFIIAALCGLLSSATSIPKVAPADQETWVLPKLTTNHSQLIDIINARNLWGMTETGTHAKLKWHVFGIINNGSNRVVLLAYEGKPVKALKVGDTLPNNSKIIRIEKDRFVIMTSDKKEQTIRIYKYDNAQ